MPCRRWLSRGSRFRWWSMLERPLRRMQYRLTLDETSLDLRRRVRMYVRRWNVFWDGEGDDRNAFGLRLAGPTMVYKHREIETAHPDGHRWGGSCHINRGEMVGWKSNLADAPSPSIGGIMIETSCWSFDETIRRVCIWWSSSRAAYIEEKKLWFNGSLRREQGCLDYLASWGQGLGVANYRRWNNTRDAGLGEPPHT